MKLKSKIFIGVLTLLLIVNTSSTYAQESNPIEGRWDLVIEKDGKKLPSWLEIRHSGFHTLVGRFVYAFGSARPISEIKVIEGIFSFEIPPQWEPGNTNLQFEGKMVGDDLIGTMHYTDGKTYEWEATRAPNLAHKVNPTWGKPIELFNGENLDGWHANGENQWLVESGILKNLKAGANLITNASFMDFKLHIEFRYTKGENSGIYLRGRYEVQIIDSKDSEPSDILFGGVYGFLEPNQMAAKDAGEWQSYDITLIGRRVTIVANGLTIINDQIIPGITGGALDSDEGEPGPFFLQGDHGPIEFRNIIVTPLETINK